VIIDGIRYLEEFDYPTFKELTERDLIVHYHKDRFIPCGYSFTIPDSYVEWGRPGIALCVAAGLIYLAEQWRWTIEGKTDPDTIIPRIAEWVSCHEIPDELKQLYLNLN